MYRKPNPNELKKEYEGLSKDINTLSEQIEEAKENGTDGMALFYMTQHLQQMKARYLTCKIQLSSFEKPEQPERYY